MALARGPGTVDLELADVVRRVATDPLSSPDIRRYVFFGIKHTLRK